MTIIYILGKLLQMDDDDRGNGYDKHGSVLNGSGKVVTILGLW
jgi:hypothetical protein